MFLTGELFRKSGNPDDSTKPLYHGTRTILGLNDLVVSFKTSSRCPYSCNFCALPQMSEARKISEANIMQQIDWLFEEYAGTPGRLDSMTVRNEGNVLNPKEFPTAALFHLFKRLRNDAQDINILSLETRLEFVTEGKLVAIGKSLPGGTALDITTGFETQNERILNEVLGKRLSKAGFEKKVALLGRHGVGLTAYVMLKPDPKMTEHEGVHEAVMSAEYLHNLGKRTGARIMVYVNPTYAAKGSVLAREMKRLHYHPPTRESLDLVMERARKSGIAAHTDGA